MILINLVILFASLALLIKSSDYFVKAASSIAQRLGVSEFIIGLTIVAVGTSLPELASSITASFLRQDEIIIGNIVGSNIANILLILGVSAIIRPVTFGLEVLYFAVPVLIFISIVLLLLMKNYKQITRTHGLILVAFYALFLLILTQFVY